MKSLVACHDVITMTSQWAMDQLRGCVLIAMTSPNYRDAAGQHCIRADNQISSQSANTQTEFVQVLLLVDKQSVLL